MNALLLIVALLSSSVSSHMLPASGLALMQSRLRGSHTSVVVTPVASPESDDSRSSVGVQQGAVKTLGQRFSDDDESCTAEGLTPGVCALGWLARPAPFTAKKVPRGALADCGEKEGTDRLERALIAEIEAGLAGNHTGFDASRLKTLEDEMEPLFATLPHEKVFADIEGGLGLASARYFLHHHFLRTHSWYVRGLNPAGDGRKPPDHKEALRSRVAGHLLEVLEKKVGKAGLNLKTLAIFVATLEHLLHGDERERLKQAWAVHDLNLDDVVDAPGLMSVLKVFMAHYVYESQKSESGYAMTLEQGQQEVTQISQRYEGWSRISSFLEKQISLRKAVHDSGLNFEDAAKVAEKVLEFFREVSGSICKDMSQTFRALPGGESGRVSLADMREEPYFQESTEYLRAAGILDESDSAKPYVILPNYMLSSSNCDGTTSFYDLCCPSTCENHKSRLEGALAVSESPVTTMEEVVQQLAPSVAPETLQRLKQIAAGNDQPIQLHGQDFARWLHYAFPFDCPRPLDADVHVQNGNAVPGSAVEYQASAKLLFDW